MYNKEKRKMYQKKWNEANREKLKDIRRLDSRRRTLKYRTILFEALRNKCSNPNCPIPIEKMDIRALQVDHINGGGTKERKGVKGNHWYHYYVKHLYDDNGNLRYQILCAYCNWLKR